MITIHSQCSQVKTFTKRVYRRKTPSQHAAFLQSVASVDFELSCADDGADVPSMFDRFYATTHLLLDTFYTECSVTVTSRDPPYITDCVKAMLRRKNRLMRKGRVDEASALAQHIGKEITRHTKTQLSLMHENVDSGDMWACVRRLTGKNHSVDRVDDITAESLNNHYSTISTDNRYISPALKQTVAASGTEYISEWRVFNILDKLRPTATGLDGLPAWFLKLGACTLLLPAVVAVVQLFSFHFLSPTTVEAGLDLSCSKSLCSNSAR